MLGRTSDRLVGAGRASRLPAVSGELDPVGIKTLKSQPSPYPPIGSSRISFLGYCWNRCRLQKRGALNLWVPPGLAEAVETAPSESSS